MNFMDSCRAGHTQRARKVLHLVIDEKFIDQGLYQFEKNEDCGHIVILVSNHGLKNIVSEVDYCCDSLSSIKVIRQVSRTVDAVIVHSFHPILMMGLVCIPKEIPIAWIGWGYDYYDYILGRSYRHRLLPRTYRSFTLLNFQKRRKVRSILISLVFDRFLKRINAKKVRFFSPVLKQEFNLVKEKQLKLLRNTKFVPFNYGSLERNLIKGFEQSSISGWNILVGHSAAPEVNHLDLLDFCRRVTNDQTGLVLPLSYGVPEYAELVMNEFQRVIPGNRLNCLMSFLPIHDYVATLCSCRFYVSNSIRQIGLGNIVIMLYLGASVFLRNENPAAIFLRELGAIFFDVKNLDGVACADELPILTEEQKEMNRVAVANYWSEAHVQNRTDQFLQTIFSPLGAES